MVYGVKKFHQYLYGQKFEIFTDHKPLLGIFGESKPIPLHSAARVQRWAITMSAYQYRLIYRAGGKNGNADGMSRLPLENTVETEDGDEEPNKVFMVDLVNAPVTANDVKRETEKDPVLTRVRGFVMEGWPEELSASEEYLPYKRRSEELTVEMGCLMWGGRVVIPPGLREKVLKELHVGHVGMTRMKMLGRGYCWWPSMDQEVEQEVSGCEACIENARNPNVSILHPWEMASRPWSRIHVDHAGPFMGRMFFIVVDSYSKCIPQVSAPYHPSSNGAAERTVQSFKQTLRKLISSSKESVTTQISRLLFTC